MSTSIPRHDNRAIVGKTGSGKSYVEPLPTGQALQEHWLRKLPVGERKILEVLIEAHPAAIDRDKLGEVTQFARSTRDRYLQYMQNKMIVTTTRGEVRASDNLFD